MSAKKVIFGQCDCCGKHDRVLHRIPAFQAYGIETYTCAECHGEAVDAYDDELETEEPAP